MRSITPTLVKSLKPKAKRYSISSENLQITVHPTGRVVFQSYTQIKGRYVRRPIATFSNNRIEKSQLDAVIKTYAEHYLDYLGRKLPDTPMEEARKQREAKKVLEQKRQNTQQIAYEETRREEGGWSLYAEENPEEVTFAHLFQDWTESGGKKGNSGKFKKSFDNDERIFESDLKELHPMPLWAIDKGILKDVLAKVNGKTQPNRVRSLLMTLFNCAEYKDYIEFSPANNLPVLQENLRTTILKDKEIPKAWKVMHPIHKFLLCTGQRREEVAAMRRSEMDGNRWTIPDPKSARPHTILLPKFTMQWLPKETEGYDCIWRTARKGSEDENGVKRELDASVHKDTVTDWWIESRGEVGLEHVNVHDFRRTVITNLTRVTGDDTIAMKVANQKLQGVKLRYDLYMWDEEKADALAKWNRLLQKLIKG